MGFYLAVDLEEPAPLASNAGWGDVQEWGEGLEAEAFPQLVHLLEHGWSAAPPLFAELSQALQEQPPRSSDLATTLDGLLTLLRKAQGAEVVSVTDGMGPDDGQDEGGGQSGWQRTPQAPDFDKDAWSSKVRARRRAAAEGTREQL
jgi:hypothetical protein